MSKLITYEQYMTMLSERVVDNSRQLKRAVNQRRNGMEDLYGVCFSANGDADNPATFYISLSPDYVYLQRFAFKLVIKSYTSSVAGAAGSISVETDHFVISGTSTLDDSVSGSASASLDYGVHKVSTASTDWSVSVDGVDITAYLAAQHDGSWISGEGIYPTNRLENIEDFYDILEVCDALTDEGETSKVDKILASGFKKLEISSDAKFGVDLYLYMKYSSINR